jgi:putative tricarboxylic transport membrane protein
MTTTQRTADIISGIVLAAGGAAVILAALDIQSAFGERLPPRTLPLGLGSTTVVTGVLLSIRAYLYRGEDLEIKWPDREGWWRLAVTFATLVIYLLLIDPLGVAVASLVFSTFLIWYLERRVIRSLCVGVAVAVVIQFVFVNLLQLALPTGIWSR